MDNHFTVTIQDRNGLHQFNLHRFVKKALLYATLFLILLMLIATGTILYLHHSVEVAEKKKKTLLLEYKEQKKRNEALQKSMEQTQNSLEAKRKELEQFSDSLSEIEMMIGLKPTESATLQERVNTTKLTSSQRALLLELIPNGYPLKFHGVSSFYGWRTNPLSHKREFHHGIDLRAKLHTPIYAPADAIVEWAGYNKKSGFGTLIVLQHMFGFETYYGHLTKAVVKSNQFVKKGTLIGYTGNSGWSNGPHLHYEMHFMHVYINPIYFVKWTQKNYDTIFKKEKKVPWHSLITAVKNLQAQQL